VGEEPGISRLVCEANKWYVMKEHGALTLTATLFSFKSSLIASASVKGRKEMGMNIRPVVFFRVELIK
jgi:hypothetical protein